MERIIRVLNILLVLCFMPTLAMTMQADEQRTDNGTDDNPRELFLGENMLNEQYMPASAYFVVKTDGNLFLELAGESMTVALNDNPQQGDWIPSGNISTYELKEVKVGDKVTFKSAFLMNPVKITISMLGEGEVIPIELSNVSPTPGEVFSWNTSGMVTVQFNRSVRLGMAEVVCGNKTIQADDIHVYGAYVGCNIKSALASALKSGVLAPGDKFYVHLTGIADINDSSNKYNGDGVCDIEFLAPEPQVELTGMNFTEQTPIMSYYVPEEDNGLFKFTFSDNLMTDMKKQGTATLSFGNLDLAGDGLYYSENLPVSVEGNVLTVDLRGRIRTVSSMLSGSMDAVDTEVTGDVDVEHITLSLSGIKDVSGNAVASPALGSVGSFSYTLPFRQISMRDFTCDVVPGPKSRIKPGDKIEFWFSDSRLMTFAATMGMELSYEDKTDSVFYSRFDSEEAEVIYYEDSPVVIGAPDSDGGRSVYFTVVDLPVADGTNVRIKPFGIVTADGVDYSDTFAATFVYDSTADGIASVMGDPQKSVRYNLRGQKVKDDYSGLVVTNGKIMIK